MKPVTTYILAGGKSSRMGTDKGLLLLKGEPIIERIIRQLEPVSAKLVIVSNNPDYTAFGYEVIPDRLKGLGPAGGIHAALSHTATERNLVASCDMPFIRTAACAYLLEQGPLAEIVVPVHEGKTEPLLGVYNTACLSRWETLIQQGMRKLQEMIACFSLLSTDVSGHPLFNYPLFENINTPEDLEKAITLSDL